MIRTRFARFAPVALLLATVATTAHATPVDGTLGATSTGSVGITATVAPRVQISGLSDVAFTAVDAAAPQSSPQNVCVWSNTAGHKYNIKASGSGTSGAFTIASGALPAVNYTVEWAQTVAQTGGTALTAGTALTGQASAALTPTCTSGTKSASLSVPT